MKLEKKVYLLLLLLLPFCFLKGNNTSFIDYNKLAHEITKGCKTRLEKSEAIYKYLCKNIAYDTTYKIYTADECFKYKKGVCQAYCELYQRLCKPLGIDCIMVTGKSKPIDHKKGIPIIGPGHAWLLVESEEEGFYYFVDPTWGAGSVDKGVFKKKENDMSWFRVSPEWLIFTHFPDEEEYQLLDLPISERTFLSLPPLYPDLEYMGLNDENLLTDFLSGKLIDLPTFTYIKEYPLKIVSLPLENELRPSLKYKFSFEGSKDSQYALIHNNEFYQDWSIDGNIFSMEFIPYEEGTLKISASKPNQKTFYELISYDVASPTKQELERLMEISPFYSNKIRNLPGYSSVIQSIGFNEKKVLEEYRVGKLKAFPNVYINDKYPFSIIDAPINKTLSVGNKYVFEINISPDLIPALVLNNSFFLEWEREGEKSKIQFTPDSTGEIKICLKSPQDTNYIVVLGYTVK